MFPITCEITIIIFTDTLILLLLFFLQINKESEWIPVTPKKPEQKKPFVPASIPTEPISMVPKACPVQPIQPVVFPRTSMAGVLNLLYLKKELIILFYFKRCVTFDFLSLQSVDIGSIVSQRLAAMRKLRENPNDVGALNEMYRAQNEVFNIFFIDFEYYLRICVCVCVYIISIRIFTLYFFVL